MADDALIGTFSISKIAQFPNHCGAGIIFNEESEDNEAYEVP
jgi:hypothetical protein